jgi:hypothetical protein
VKLPDDVVAVKYRVVNKDDQTATKVTMTERMMEGYGYVWGSLRKDGKRWELAGTDPYTIELGDIDTGGRMEVSFLAVALGGQPGKAEEQPAK